MSDHAREAAEKLCAIRSEDWDWEDSDTEIIQAAIDAATADLKSAYDASLTAMEASHKRRDELEEKVRSIDEIAAGQISLLDQALAERDKRIAELEEKYGVNEPLDIQLQKLRGVHHGLYEQWNHVE